MLEKSDEELLLYLALKSNPLGDLVNMPAVFLNLVSFYAKLHRFGEIETCFRFLTANLTGTERVAETIGDILSKAGRFRESLSYFSKAADSESIRLKKAYALVKCGNFSDAYDILGGIKDTSGLLYKELLLDCLKRLEPEEKELIKKTDNEVLDLCVLSALQNGAVGRAPVFHGKL
jgi:tetratricopeptide (TPR) repeat protein